MKKINLVLLGFCFINSLSAQDGQVQFRDWTFERKVLAEPIGQACIAYTEARVEQNTWRLSVIQNTQHNLPTTIVISTSDNSIPTELFAQTDSNVDVHRHIRTDFLDASLGSNSFWFAPNRFTSFFESILQGSALKVKYIQGSEKQVLFSLRGSSDATNEISRACHKGNSFVNAAFYDHLDTLDINLVPTLEGASVNLAWVALRDSFRHRRAELVQLAKIETIQNQIDPLSARQNSDLAEIRQIQRDIENDRAVKRDLEWTLNSQRSQLDSKVRERDSQNVQLQNAQTNLINRENALRQARNGLVPYNQAVENSRQKVEASRLEVNRAQVAVNQQGMRVNNVRSELRSQEAQLNESQRQLGDLRSQRANAQSQYANYNVDQETHRRINSDRIYQNKLREKQQSDAAVVQTQNQIDRHEAQLQALRQQLQQCQSKPGRDCKPIRMQIQQKENQLAAAKQNHKAEVNHNMVVSNQLGQRAASIRIEVESDKKQLANRIASLDNQIQNKQAQVNQQQNRVATLRNTELPQAERNLAAAESSLRMQQTQYGMAQAQQRQSEQNLENYKIRVELDRKERDCAIADQRVRDLRAVVANTNNEIRNLQSVIASNQSRLNDVNYDISRLDRQLVITQQDLREVNSQIAILTDKKNDLLPELNSIGLEKDKAGQLYLVNVRDMPRPRVLPGFPIGFFE